MTEERVAMLLRAARAWKYSKQVSDDFAADESIEDDLFDAVVDLDWDENDAR